MQFILKVLISAIVIAGASELSKRSSFLAALLISLPLTSVLAFIWVYIEQKDVVKIAAMSYSVLWLIIPSLTFFIILPLALNNGLNFYVSIVASSLLTAIAYAIFSYVLTKYVRI